MKQYHEAFGKVTLFVQSDYMQRNFMQCITNCSWTSHMVVLNVLQQTLLNQPEITRTDATSLQKCKGFNSWLLLIICSGSAVVLLLGAINRKCLKQWLYVEGKVKLQNRNWSLLINLAQLSVLATCKPCAVKLLTVNFSTAQREACYNKLNND